MRRHMLLGATALSTLTALPSHATPDSIWELFTAERIANQLMQSVVISARGFADIRYEYMDFQPLEGRAILTGLRIAPYEDYMDADCAITIDRAVITTAPLDQIEVSAIEIDLLGAELDMACLSEWERSDLEEMGIANLALQRGEIRAEYDIASGALQIGFEGVSAGNGELRGFADFAYAAINLDREEPILDLAYGELEFVNDGLWDALTANVPPGMFDAEMLTTMMLSEFAPTPGTFAPAPAPAPTPGQAPPVTKQSDGDLDAAREVIGDMAEVLARFAQAPERLHLALAPSQPQRLNEALFHDPARAFVALTPSLFIEEDRDSRRITAEEFDQITTWVDGGDVTLSESDLLRYARAFITGHGAPRHPQLGLELLTPAIEAGNSEALDLALSQSDVIAPVYAYQIAREAAAQGDRRALAQLDRLERGLSITELSQIMAQDGAPPAPEDHSPAELREMAYAHLTGLGARRDYPLAYYYGLLAMAAGDAAAGSVIADVEAMAARRDEGEAEIWEGLFEDMRNASLESWFGRQ